LKHLEAEIKILEANQRWSTTVNQQVVEGAKKLFSDSAKMMLYTEREKSIKVANFKSKTVLL
jgi:DNA replicative helicase MCM subunit Mcm2 (Cdc46/Mcm family)